MARHPNYDSLCRYDMDKSGAIDKKEMVKVMNSIYAMLGDEKGTGTQTMNDLVCQMQYKTLTMFSNNFSGNCPCC